MFVGCLGGFVCKFLSKNHEQDTSENNFKPGCLHTSAKKSTGTGKSYIQGTLMSTPCKYQNAN